MIRRTPLKAGRKKEPTAAEKRHFDRVASKGCCVCGGGATIHHVTGYADRMGRFSRSHQLVAPLCPRHHQAVHDNASDPQSVEMLSHRGFYNKHGVNLLALAQALWLISQDEERDAA